jgi:hypothetical protein
MAAYARELVKDWPPLDEEQRARLAFLFKSAAEVPTTKSVRLGTTAGNSNKREGDHGC